jgi:hypothetical protein
LRNSIEVEAGHYKLPIAMRPSRSAMSLMSRKRFNLKGRVANIWLRRGKELGYEEDEEAAPGVLGGSDHRGPGGLLRCRQPGYP